MLASQGGHLDTVLTLLDYGANAGVKNRVSLNACSGDYIHVNVNVFSTTSGGYDSS